MRLRKTLLALFFVSLAAAHPASAGSISNTGTLSSSTDFHMLDFTIGAGSEFVTIQSWGFGGGVNAAGNTIAAGGFDPFIGLFRGVGSSAHIISFMGQTFGTSDLLSNFGSFSGCPPAGTVNLGGPVCGDVTMKLMLGPGIYTIVLSDAAYIPNAIFDNGTLGQGFSDFTGGGFQTCNTTDAGTTCATDTANWAFDLTTSPAPATPEPSTLILFGSGFLGLLKMRRRSATKF
jgi:hypothetical protein